MILRVQGEYIAPGGRGQRIVRMLTRGGALLICYRWVDVARVGRIRVNGVGAMQ